MKKRFLSAILALCMLLTLLPGAALAGAVPPDALDFTAATEDVSGEGYTWSQAEKNLTLTSFSMDSNRETGQTQPGIALPDGSTLALVGDNFVTITGSQVNGIACRGSLTVTGSGNLTVKTTGDGFSSAPTIGGHERGNLTFSGTGTIDVEADHIGLTAERGTLKISSGIIKTHGKTNSGKGLYVFDGDIEITGGTVTAIGDTAEGIYAYSDTVDAGIRITGGKVTVNGKNFGIVAGSLHPAGKNFTVTIGGDTELEVTADCAIYATNQVIVSGGKIMAQATAAGNPGIRSVSGNISVSGGADVTAGSKIAGFYADAGEIAFGGTSVVNTSGGTTGVYAKVGRVLLTETATLNAGGGTAGIIAPALELSDGTTCNALHRKTEVENINHFTAYGVTTLTNNFTTSANNKLTVPAGAHLTIPQAVVLDASGGIEHFTLDGGLTVTGTLRLPDGTDMDTLRDIVAHLVGSGEIFVGSAKANLHTVSFDSKDGNTVDHRFALANEALMSQPEPPVRQGYTFSGWYTSPDGGVTLSETAFDFATVITGALTLYAKWTIVSTGGSGVTTYVITATAGEHGSISPSGKVSVERNRSKTFTVAPDEGYTITDVLVDGVSMGAVDSYTFEKITAKHTISASFEKKAAAPSFVDVDADAWYYDAVAFVCEKGLFTGTSATTFSPELSMSRAMLWTVLARMDGQDVSGGATWYEKAQTWAAARGVTDGASPETDMTREQLAVMLYRYAKAEKLDADLKGFSDGDSVSAWAADAMSWAVAQGILTGKSGNRLDPQSTASRAEVATMLQRFISR